MTDAQELLYIEDDKGRRLHYHFTPAAFASNFVPLIVVLHNEDREDMLHFEYKMWNVLTPIDTYSDNEKHTCWLGENDDHFIKELLQELIEQKADELECEDDIYMYGSSMGGYGAILHALLSKANAVFAHAPLIKLSNTDTKEHNLNNFLNATDSFPIFYLCDEDSKNNEIVSFANECKKRNIKAHLDFCPESGDDKEHKLKKVLNMFEHVVI
ncbi:hypothetical protein GJV85_06395 [Sulfurimonas aquatica]|uniref:Alpha/beta hydrolase n=1 Tax=Sulfurimonas aquatica TaxID=2672570 RepID=A0A975GCQ6_9BACT|nr:hypothetical protein [Sulfurimonas aquatica]QSZ41752.1 hypothetical protein GJV85_06395 [Sulfurimonas aquatica]